MPTGVPNSAIIAISRAGRKPGLFYCLLSIMRYRYTVIYSWFRWRRSGTRSYIADLVDCRLWLLGGSHLLKKLDIIAIICYNRGVIGQGICYTRSYIADLVPDHTLPAGTGTRPCPRAPACARTLHTRTYAYARGELEAAIAAASWKRAGKFDTSWKMCYNKAVIKERSCYYDPSRLD